MYKKSDIAKIESAYKYICDIETIISNHLSVEKAIEDLEGEYALLMCLVQIGESVIKLSDEKILDQVPAPQIISLRNRIVHGYDTVDHKIIKDILVKHIPELKAIIENILHV